MELHKQNTWQKNSNFNYKCIKDEKHSDDNVISSLFHGATIDKCEFTNASFDNSDFEATRILNSKLNTCTLTGCDMHSLVISGTHFFNVDFGASNIVDCQFINCTFISCSFQNSTINNSLFNACKLDNTIFLNCSANLNIFKQCNICKSTFKNVFYYTHFDQCNFSDVTFESYLLGYTYGLTANNLKMFNYLFMGESCNLPTTRIIKEMGEVFYNRKMIINVGILFLNDPRAQIDITISKCFTYLYKYIEQGNIVPKEQIDFFSIVTQHMYDNKLLSPVTLFGLLYTLDNIVSLKTDELLVKTIKYISSLKNSIQLLYYNAIDNIGSSITQVNDNLLYTIVITYKMKPEIALIDILHEINPLEQKPLLLKTKKGSFIEWISCTGNLITSLEIFLALLGVTSPILWDIYKDKKSSKTKMDKENLVIEITNNIDPTLSLEKIEALTTIQSTTLSKFAFNNINSTVKVIIKNNFISTENFKGYNNENVNKIEIRKN